MLVSQNATIGDDVRTIGTGTVLIRADIGNVVVSDTDNDGFGISTVNGDIFIRSGFDTTVSTKISSNTADIAIDAGRLINLTNTIETSTGDLLLRAAESITMSNDAAILADDVIVNAGPGAIRLGLIQGDQVSIRAGTDILDGNGAFETNVRAAQLRMEAGRTIGLGDPLGIATTNVRAIDLEVGRLAALAPMGIFVSEVAAGGDLTIDHVDGFAVKVDVRQSQFASTIAPVFIDDQSAPLDDLMTTAFGSIQVVVRNGLLMVNDGTDGDRVGIDARDGGGIWLETLSPSGDILVNADVRSTTPNGDLGSGTILLRAGDDLLLDARVSTRTTVLLQTGDWIDERSDQAHIVADRLGILAGTYAHLHNVQINTLNAQVGLQATVAGAEGKITNASLDNTFQVQNDIANEKGQEFLNVLGKNLTDANLNPNIVDGKPLSDTRDDLRYQKRFDDGYALYLRNEGLLTVEQAVGFGREPNLYLETVASDLIVSGQIQTVSRSQDEGGIVLIADGNFILEPNATIETGLNASNFDRSQAIRNVDLNERFFNGGEGIGFDKTSTQFVIRDNSLGALSEDFRTHILQRVALQFGSADEAGFLSFIGYADGLLQQFDVAGEEGTPGERSGLQTSIGSRSINSNDVGLFTRSSAFTNQFLDTNQLLPTTAVIRRAADFFIFEDGGNVDLTVASSPIEEVRSLGTRGAVPLPVDPAPPVLPTARMLVVSRIIDGPVDQVEAAVELKTIISKQGEVAVYRVEFEDTNENGQAELAELPSVDGVLKQIEESPVDHSSGRGGEGSSAERGKDSEDSKSKPGIEKIRTLQPASGGSPTASEIDAWKAELRNDPSLSSGAYSIIEIGVDDSKSVLDVFPVRDWPEEDDANSEPSESQKDNSDDAALPAPQPDKASTSGHGSPRERSDSVLGDSKSAFETESNPPTTVALAGALWFLRLAKSNADQNFDKGEGEDNEAVPLASYSRRSRRIRRLQSMLSNPSAFNGDNT